MPPATRPWMEQSWQLVHVHHANGAPAAVVRQSGEWRPGWTVVPDPVYGSDINWTLGTPHNGLQNGAHSGRMPGSDLNGQSFSFLASSFLYSPVIDLSGVSQATLTFWHSFDFSSEFEDGQLGISTNSSTPPPRFPR